MDKLGYDLALRNGSMAIRAPQEDLIPLRGEQSETLGGLRVGAVVTARAMERIDPHPCFAVSFCPYSRALSATRSAIRDRAREIQLLFIRCWRRDAIRDVRLEYGGKCGTTLVVCGSIADEANGGWVRLRASRSRRATRSSCCERNVSS